MNWNDNPVDLWKEIFEWYSEENIPGFISYKQKKREIHNDNFILNSRYLNFNWSNYLCGVTFSYYHENDDIYKKSIVTGDSENIINFYNPYDVIKEFYSNIHSVDIACDFNVFTGRKYYKLDDTNVKPGNRILLFENINSRDNGIYIVNNNYFLERTEDLSNEDKTFRYQLYCRSGTYGGKYFYLEPDENNEFPVDGDYINFNIGRGLLLKNIINYDLYSDNSKIIFTDVDIARKSLDKNYNLYENVELIGNSVETLTPFIIEYKDIIYKIKLSSTTEYSDFYNIDKYNIYNSNGNTHIKVSKEFPKNKNDYVNLKLFYNEIENPFIDNSYLNIYSFIKEIKNDNLITISDYIPNYILNYNFSYLSGKTINKISGETFYDFEENYYTNFTYNDGWKLDGYFNIINNSLTYNVTGNTSNNDKAIQYLWKNINSGSNVKLSFYISDIEAASPFNAKLWLSGNTSEQLIADFDSSISGQTLNEIWINSNDNYNKSYLEFDSTNITGITIDNIKFNEVINEYPIYSGITDYFGFNLLSGETNLLKNEINQNHATGFSINIEDGFVGECASFNDNSYIKLPNGIISSKENFSISLWFKTKNNGPLLGYQDTEVGNFTKHLSNPIIYIGIDGRLRCKARNFLSNRSYLYYNYPITTKEAVNDNNWHNIILTVEKSGQTYIQNAYLDAQYIGSEFNLNHENLMFNQLGASYITKNWPSSNEGWWYYKGLIDDFSLWNRPLNIEEIKFIYNFGEGSSYLGLDYLLTEGFTYDGNILTTELNRGIVLDQTDDTEDYELFNYTIKNLNYTEDNTNNYINNINNSFFNDYINLDIQYIDENTGLTSNIIKNIDDTYSDSLDYFFSDIYTNKFEGNVTGIKDKSFYAGGINESNFVPKTFLASKGERFLLRTNIDKLTQNKYNIINNYYSDFNNFFSGFTTNVINDKPLSNKCLSYYDFESKDDLITNSSLTNHNNVIEDYGIVRKSYYFDGNISYSKLEDNFFDRKLTGSTISLWFKSSTYGIILGQENYSKQNYNPLIYIGIDGVLRGGFYGVNMKGSSVIDNKWHNSIIKIDDYKQYFYLDGNLINEYPYKWNKNNFIDIEDWKINNNSENWDVDYTDSVEYSNYEFKCENSKNVLEKVNLKWKNNNEYDVNIYIDADLETSKSGNIKIYKNGNLEYTINGDDDDNISGKTFEIKPDNYLEIILSNNQNKNSLASVKINNIIYGKNVLPNNDLPITYIGRGFGFSNPSIPTLKYFYYKGNIDEFSYWNEDLSESEIKFIYNDGLSSTYRDINSVPYIRSNFNSQQNNKISIESEYFKTIENYWYKCNLDFIEFNNIDKIEMYLVNSENKIISSIKSENDSLISNDLYTFNEIDFLNSTDPSVIFESNINISGDCKLIIDIYPINVEDSKNILCSIDIFEYHDLNLIFDIKNTDKKSISNSIVVSNSGTSENILKIDNITNIVEDCFLFCKLDVLGTPIFKKEVSGEIELFEIKEDFKANISTNYKFNNHYFYYDEFKFYTGEEFLLAEGSNYDGNILISESEDQILLEESATKDLKFKTDNNYINYELQPFLYKIWTGFTEDYEIYNNFSINNNEHFNIEYYNSDSGLLLKLNFENNEILDNFKDYTYIVSGNTYLLILEKAENYLIVEKPENFNINSYVEFKNISKLGIISSLLLDNYRRYSKYKISINDIHLSKKISNKYAEIIQLNEDIKKYTTGIIYGNEDNKYIFKIFNLDDDNMDYYPVEVSKISMNGKYSFPILLENNNFNEN